MNANTNPTDLVARFAVGGEACDDGLGAVCVRRLAKNEADQMPAGFSVFVNGGLLPNGSESREFDGDTAAVDALEYAFAVVRELASDLVELDDAVQS